MPLLWAIPNLSREKCVRVQARLHLREFLRKQKKNKKKENEKKRK